MYRIYVIKCTDNKYYIGKSTDITHRYSMHLNGMGSRWTQIYTPVELIDNFPIKNKFDEDNTVKQYMDTFGINNVRGGSYSSVVLSTEQILLLKKELATANDKCFLCFMDGHFATCCHSDEVVDCDGNIKLLYEYYLTCNCIWDTHNVIKFIKSYDYVENAQWLRMYINDTLQSINNTKIYKCMSELKSLLNNQIQMTIIERLC